MTVAAGCGSGIPELDPYPAGEGSAGCPAASAPDLKAPSGAHRGGAGGPAGLSVRRPVRSHPSPGGRSSGWLPTRGPARRLLAVYYLACGQVLPSGPAVGPGREPALAGLLRLRYHERVCAARQYDRAAGSQDACLSQMFRDLSGTETRHARQLMALLEQNILAF